MAAPVAGVRERPRGTASFAFEAKAMSSTSSADIPNCASVWAKCAHGRKAPNLRDETNTSDYYWKIWHASYPAESTEKDRVRSGIT